MLRRLLFSILTITALAANSQTLRKYEYWIDSDYSKHVTVNNNNEEISFSISTQNQSEGVHFLNFRAQNSDNNWGTITRYLYYIPDNLSANPTLVGYEYWIDGDYSQKKSVKSSSSDVSTVIDISKLTEGVHFYNFRAKNSDDVWGNLYRYLFYVPEKASVNPTLKSYEYWLDEDYSKRTTTSSTTGDANFMVNISSLAEGVHFLNFRAKNSDDVWGNLYRYLFYVPEKENANPTLNGYEYWLDDDYSKRSTSVSTLGDVSLKVDISSLTEGVHFFNFRAKNSEGIHSAIKRYLFYIPGKDTQGVSPIVGYRYGFNSKSEYVSVTERNEFELNNFMLPIPTNIECANVEDGVFTIDQATDNVVMNRTSKISFSMQFKNKAGNWSSPTVEEFTQSDQITKTAKSLAVQKQVSLNKVQSGDFEVVKMVIPTSRTYYFRTTQSCDMQLYHNGSKMGNKISGESLMNTYNIGLDAGTYYAVVYNMVKDANNTTDNVVLKLMLTDNITPTPEIQYSNETVSITCAQEGAEIFYTLDGSEPSKESTKYSSPFKLTHNATIKAIATYSDLAESNIASYTVNSYKVNAPTIDFADLKVYISTTTTAANIYYSIDGSDPNANGILYTNPIEVNQNCTVKAIAKRDGYNNSDITSKYIDVDNVTCAKPTFSLNGYSLTISTLTDGATIYYTTDGSTPTVSSNKYNGAITLSRNCTVKAIVSKIGQITSPVASYTVDVFKTAQPTFAFANNTLIVSCQTPGAVIYYTIGSAKPSTSSNRYTKPILLSDNRAVNVIAITEGFNYSDVETYIPTTFACEDVQVLYDGRTISMKTQDGVTIHYTKDGSEPTTASSIYSGSILLDGLCTIKAIAVKEYKNNSNVTTYETPCYYNGGILRMAKPGYLHKAFEWCGIGDIDNVIIYGELNDVDLKFISTMPALNRISLSVASIVGNALSDGIFANSLFRSIVLPSSLTKCGKNIFSGNKRLCAVKWNADIAVPSDMFGGINNPNLLLYVNSKSYAPASIQNIVVNSTAESIVLHDGFDFYACDGFKANNIVYTHTYNMQTTKGVSRGWESITLPFTVTRYTHSTNGNIAPFAKNVANAKPFWLYELNERDGFVKARDIEANKPYIISMPNNADYAEDYILGGQVSFIGENVTVPETSSITTIDYGHFTFIPCFENIDKSTNIYALNTYQEYNRYPEGSLFASNLRNVKPFEAYMKSTSNMAKSFLPIFDNSADGIDDTMLMESSIRIWSENHKLIVYSDYRQTLKIYAVSGMQVKTVELQNGLNIIDIAVGVYIINGMKISIK